METKTKERIIFTMRLDTQIHAQIKELANKNKRSIAKQMEFMLEQNLKENK